MNSRWMIFDTMIMVFYFIAMLGVGVYYSNKTKTSEDFLVAGRSVGFIRLFGTVTSTDIGAGYVIATVGMAYSVGFGASWLVFSSLLGAWTVAFFLSKKLKPLADKMKFVSSAHFLRYRYDKRASLLGSIMVIFANVTFVGTQIVGGAAIISAVTGMQLSTAAWIAGSVVIIYTAMGGLNSVIDTDVIQVAVIVFGIFIIGVPIGIIKVGGFASLYQNLPSSFFSVGGVPSATVIKWFIAMVPSYLISMITWQRIFAAKDLKTVRKAYAFSGILIWPIFGFLICILGMTAAVLYPGLESELVFTTFIVKALPAGVTGIIIAALTAAIMSTADSGLMCATTVFCNDIVKGYIKPDISDEQIIKTGKVTIIVIGILSLSIALYIPQILKLMMYAYQFNAAIFWPAMLGLFWKGATSEAAFWSLLVGGIGSVVWAVIGSPYGLPPIYIAFPLTLVMMVVISKFTVHSDGEHTIDVNSATV